MDNAKVILETKTATNESLEIFMSKNERRFGDFMTPFSIQRQLDTERLSSFLSLTFASLCFSKPLLIKILRFTREKNEPKNQN